MADFIQQSFGGGMNLGVDDTRLGTNEYGLAHNVRNLTFHVELTNSVR